MKILVTGATGFIGYEVSRQLSLMGSRPRLMYKRNERRKLLSNLDADIVKGDLADVSSLKMALNGIDTVIHLGARATFESYSKLKPINITGTYNLFQESIKAGVKNFLFGSSMFVYKSSSEQIDKSTQPSPVIDYGIAKLEVEKRLFEIADNNEINVAAIRLPHVYGTQNLLFGQIRRGFILCPGRGGNTFSHLHVEDAARVLIEAARSGWSGTSPVADNQPSTWNEFFDVILKHYPMINVYRIPEQFSYISSRVVDLVYSFINRPNIYTPDTVTGFNLNLPVKPGVLWDELGISPMFETINEGIPRVLDGYIPYRWVHPINDKSRLM